MSETTNQARAATRPPEGHEATAVRVMDRTRKAARAALERVLEDFGKVEGVELTDDTLLYGSAYEAAWREAFRTALVEAVKNDFERLFDEAYTAADE